LPLHPLLAKKMTSPKDIAETLLDPKCGTYLNKATDQFEYVVKIKDEYVSIGSYSRRATEQIHGDEFKQMAESKIWTNFFS